MDWFAKVSWLEDNFVFDLVFYPVKLLTHVIGKQLDRIEDKIEKPVDKVIEQRT